MCQRSPRMRHLDRRSQCTVRVVRRSFRLIDAAAIYRVCQWTIPPHFFSRAFLLEIYSWIMSCFTYSVQHGKFSKREIRIVKVVEYVFMKYTCEIIHYDDLFMWIMICIRWYDTLPLLNTHEIIGTVLILLFTKWKGREAVAIERYRNAHMIFFINGDLVWKHTIVGSYLLYINKCYCIYALTIKINLFHLERF